MIFSRLFVLAMKKVILCCGAHAAVACMLKRTAAGADAAVSGSHNDRPSGIGVELRTVGAGAAE